MLINFFNNVHRTAFSKPTFTSEYFLDGIIISLIIVVNIVGSIHTIVAQAYRHNIILKFGEQHVRTGLKMSRSFCIIISVFRPKNWCGCLIRFVICRKGFFDLHDRRTKQLFTFFLSFTKLFLNRLISF